MKNTYSIVLAFVSLLGIVRFGSGAERTFVLTGVVTQVPSGLSSEFTTGDPISGSYTFETTTADTLPANPNVGNYIGAVSNFEMTIGSYSLNIDSGNGDITVEDNVNGQDVYTVVSFATGQDINGLDPALMALQLRDSSETAFDSEAMPVNPPSPLLFDSPEITIDWSPTFLRLTGTLQTLTVPEPTTSWLVWLSAMFALGRVRLRS